MVPVRLVQVFHNIVWGDVVTVIAIVDRDHTEEIEWRVICRLINIDHVAMEYSVA